MLFSCLGATRCQTTLHRQVNRARCVSWGKHLEWKVLFSNWTFIITICVGVHHFIGKLADHHHPPFNQSENYCKYLEQAMPAYSMNNGHWKLKTYSVYRRNLRPQNFGEKLSFEQGGGRNALRDGPFVVFLTGFMPKSSPRFEIRSLVSGD